MKPMYKRSKIDIGLVSQALNNTNATGRYFNMAMYRKALAILNGGAMAAGTTTKIEFLQAKDASGTDSKVIADANAVITANTNVTVLQCVVGAPNNGDTIVINSVTFTKAAATDATKREFADADGLVTCVNDSTYGVSGVTASNNAGTVTFVASDPGETVITGTKTGAALTLSTVQAQAYAEVDVSSLDINNDFTHIAVKITTTANSNVAAVLLRGDERFEPIQKVGAGASA